MVHTGALGKLLEHAMKVLERVIEGRVGKIVKIDNMQFGFMAGRSTTDAIFIVHQLQEKYLEWSCEQLNFVHRVSQMGS